VDYLANVLDLTYGSFHLVVGLPGLALLVGAILKGMVELAKMRLERERLRLSASTIVAVPERKAPLRNRRTTP
jgi:hypothetical protein